MRVPCACGVCASCMKIAAGDHPDFIEAQHEKPGSFGVDDVRRLRQDVRIKPYSGDFKIYLLPDAEKLTAQAQNALLKTLEEPPDYACSRGVCVFRGGRCRRKNLKSSL